MKTNFVILFSILGFSLLAQTPGSLDPTFGIGGKVITSITAGADRAYGVAQQPDGKIVLAGFSTSTITGKDFTCARYKVDGTLDSTFGNFGIVVRDLQLGSDDVANSLTIQSDGKIILAGYSDDGTSKGAALVRLNIDGSIDLSFGINGVVITDFISLNQDEIKVVKIHSLSGKIIVGGTSVESTSIAKPIVARYLANGTIDSTFNTTGILSIMVEANDQFRAFSVEDLEVQSNGKISAVGWKKQVSTSITTIYWASRILSNGTMDNTFSTDGVVSYGDSGGSCFAYAMSLKTNGDYIVAGTKSYFGANTFRVLDILSNGNIPAVSTSYTISGDIDIAYDIEEDINGEYVLGGTSGSASNNSFAIARITASHALEPSFGSGGIVTTIFGTNLLNECFDILIQPDNKIVAVGYTGNDFAIARYLGNASSVSLNDLHRIEEFNVFPNPSNDLVCIETTLALRGKKFEIFNSIGTLVLSNFIEDGKTSISFKALPVGIYFFKIDGSIKKIIKE